MQKLMYENAVGKRVTFDLSSQYIFWRANGLSFPATTSIQTQSSGQNGYSLHNVLMESRVITLEGHVLGQNQSVRSMYQLRKQLNATCNPLSGVGVLTYSNDHGEWRIPAYCKNISYNDKMKHAQTVTMEFECPSPFWLSSEEYIVSLAYVGGGIHFPVKTPHSFGVMGYMAIIDNDSDVPVPLIFTINGGSVNPVIRNETTGEFIKLAKHIQFGDKLYINTDPENLEVSLIRIDTETHETIKVNAYGYLTHDSTLLKLALGSNRLTFESDDDDRRVKITIGFRKRYIGV